MVMIVTIQQLKETHKKIGKLASRKVELFLKGFFGFLAFIVPLVLLLDFASNKLNVNIWIILLILGVYGLVLGEYVLFFLWLLIVHIFLKMKNWLKTKVVIYY